MFTGETATDISELILDDCQTAYLHFYTLETKDGKPVQVEVRATTNGGEK